MNNENKLVCELKIRFTLFCLIKRFSNFKKHEYSGFMYRKPFINMFKISEVLFTDPLLSKGIQAIFCERYFFLVFTLVFTKVLSSN